MVPDDAFVGLTRFLDWLDEHPDNLYLLEHDYPTVARRLRRVLGGVHNHATGVRGLTIQAGDITGGVTIR